jgi:hypothetical protein
MKDDTKELIRWAEEHFRQYRINIQTHPEKHGLGPYGVDRESNYATDFLHFLKTLPEIEKKLCFGGYIQDKNGTPCCHGDKIINERIINNEKEKGVLYWSVDDRRFYCKIGGVLHSLCNDFKKDEK